MSLVLNIYDFLVQSAAKLRLIAAEWMYHPYHFEMYQS